MRLDKQQRKLFKELCEKHDITEQQLMDIVKAPFRFMRETTKNIDLTNVVTEEEFNNSTKNFNIPSIGKIYANYNNYKRWQKK